MDRYHAFLAVAGADQSPEAWHAFMHQMRVLYHGAGHNPAGLHPIADPDHFTAFIKDHAVLYVPDPDFKIVVDR